VCALLSKGLMSGHCRGPNESRWVPHADAFSASTAAARSQTRGSRTRTRSGCWLDWSAANWVAAPWEPTRELADTTAHSRPPPVCALANPLDIFLLATGLAERAFLFIRERVRMNAVVYEWRAAEGDLSTAASVCTELYLFDMMLWEYLKDVKHVVHISMKNVERISFMFLSFWMCEVFFTFALERDIDWRGNFISNVYATLFPTLYLTYVATLTSSTLWFLVETIACLLIWIKLCILHYLLLISKIKRASSLN
jgi:hypothetical protein